MCSLRFLENKYHKISYLLLYLIGFRPVLTQKCNFNKRLVIYYYARAIVTIDITTYSNTCDQALVALMICVNCNDLSLGNVSSKKRNIEPFDGNMALRNC